MSDDTTKGKLRRRKVLAGEGSPPPGMEKRIKAYWMRQPIVRISVSIFDAETGWPPNITWRVSPYILAKAMPDIRTALLNRVTQELQAVPERLEEQGFPSRDRCCSFCGKYYEQVHRLIAGEGGVNICDECIDQCHEIIEDEREQLADHSPQGEPGAGLDG